MTNDGTNIVIKIDKELDKMALEFRTREQILACFIAQCYRETCYKQKQKLQIDPIYFVPPLIFELE